MLKTFLLAGGSGNGDFRFPLRSVKQRLEQALLDIGYKDNKAANLHMQAQKLTYKDICTHAEDTYRMLHDRKECPPARHARDSKAPPAAFRHLANDPTPRAEVLNLMQSKTSANGSDTKKGTCHNCGKPGHWSRECPDAKGKSKSGGGGRKGGHGQNDRSKGAPKSWILVAPGSGDPQTKPVNGKTFHWCAACKRWTTTHSTETHTGAKKNKSTHGCSRGAAVKDASLVYNPSVRTIEATMVPSLSDALFFLRSLLYHFPFLALLIYPMVKWLVPFIEFEVVKTHQVSMFLMAESAAVDWMHIVSQIRSQFDLLWNTFRVFVETYNIALLAPLIWITLLLFLFRPSMVAPPDKDDDEAEHVTRAYRRAVEADARRRRRLSMKRSVGSIRTHGLHCRYPLDLRAMGYFIRGRAPTIGERHRRMQSDSLHSTITSLVRHVALTRCQTNVDDGDHANWYQNRRGMTHGDYVAHQERTQEWPTV